MEKNVLETVETAALLKPNYESEILAVIKGNFTPNVMREHLEDYHENDQPMIIYQHCLLWTKQEHFTVLLI